MDLIATKSLTYNTRRLLPGDHFETKSDTDGRLLIGIKKARAADARPRATVPTPPPALVQQIETPVDDIAVLRAAYEKATGKRPFNGWNTDQLTAKIAEASEEEVGKD